MKMKIAVIGAGVSGLVAAYTLAKAGVDVVLYEKEEYLGGHSKTVTIDGVDLDLGFMVFNRVTYPNMMEFFENLGVEMERSDMSFSVSLGQGHDYEWGSRNGLSSLFAQKSNAINPRFLNMIREIIKFKNDVIEYIGTLESNPELDRNETLGSSFSHVIPMCSSIWSSPSEKVLDFSAFSVLSFCRNHHLLQLFGRPQWLTIKGRSHTYVNKVREELESRGCKIKTGCAVLSVSTAKGGCCVVNENGDGEEYEGCVVAVHAPDALEMLGEEATYQERRILGAFQYAYSDIFLHHDDSLMPQKSSAWSAWNFLGTPQSKVCLTYWLNVLQNIKDSDLPFLVTLNPPYVPKKSLLKWTTSHPIPSVAASKSALEFNEIQGKRKLWFCGAYQGYGFHEDGLKLVGRWGHNFVFEGANNKSCLNSSLRVHNPLFYWKVATQADLGLADAYINGDISFIDAEEGLLNLFLIFIASRDADNGLKIGNSQRGWWTPLFITAGIASAKYFWKHLSRQNTLTQARRNISRHYDLSNDLFALFLDETMTYSSAIFKKENEDLKSAQLRKVSLLIEKARINSRHEVLEIGCGWGCLAIEVVKRTGCKYTGITLSEEQLKYAQMKAKEAGLEGNITFLLCDYRQLPINHKYDRIISCEMLEGVGHEFMEEFFGCCDSVLAENGLLVLQFISIPDERYDEYRRSSDFIKEYIFPGGCLPSLSRVTSAMASASRLCVEHLENIGIHYYQTLIYWRNNFMNKKSEILSLGFDEKFIRTWEYYFVYCAAGFKSRTLGNYQMVFSRPGNLKAFHDPYESMPAV